MVGVQSITGVGLGCQSVLVASCGNFQDSRFGLLETGSIGGWIAMQY